MFGRKEDILPYIVGTRRMGECTRKICEVNYVLRMLKDLIMGKFHFEPILWLSNIGIMSLLWKITNRIII